MRESNSRGNNKSDKDKACFSPLTLSLRGSLNFSAVRRLSLRERGLLERPSLAGKEIGNSRSLSRISKLAAAISFGFSLAATPALGAEPVAYRYSKPIEYAGGQTEALLAVPLDSQVYTATRDGYPDLRLLDQAGAETPFLLEKSVEPHSEIVHERHGGGVAGMKPLGAAGIEVLLRADKDTPPTDGLTLVTPLADYEQRVQVFGSDDGKNWSPLVQDAAIYDYSRYMDVSNRDIPLPANATATLSW